MKPLTVQDWISRVELSAGLKNSLLFYIRNNEGCKLQAITKTSFVKQWGVGEKKWEEFDRRRTEYLESQQDKKESHL